MEIWKPNVTVAALIERDGYFLLVEEETADGLRFNQPAGHLDEGESLVAACAREAMEETAHIFTPTELVTTFVDLVKWVEGGVKPAGDNVLDAATVADPNFGCTFTDKTAPRIWDNPALAFLKPPACPQ